MEPLQPIIDRNVLQFLVGHTFQPADLTIRSDGVCRLNPEMARSVIRGLGTEAVSALTGETIKLRKA